MNGVLEIKNVSKAFGGIKAVQDFNLSLGAEQVVGLIGPNGAGKTTVFNLITGIYVPDSGQITLMGEPVTGLRPDLIALKGVARTFQNIRLFKELTVIENVMVALEARSGYSVLTSLTHAGPYSRQVSRARCAAMEILRVLGLEADAGKRATALPYGHQRKLEIARALALSPRILLLDEPTSGMNPVETEEMISTIARIQKQFSLAILMIEHHMGVVMSICDRIVVLNFGKTIAAGTPQEVRSNPAVIEAYLGREDE
ncbi:MAG TPA: ABC transporter ATP-binding protein [Firmicutes bacterium]|nr:ABC transporter ATP-binding protein [Bacillota bacterium]